MLRKLNIIAQKKINLVNNVRLFKIKITLKRENGQTKFNIKIDLDIILNFI